MGPRVRLNGNAVETCQTDANGNIMGQVYASDSVGRAVTVEANAIRLTGGTALANFTETTVGLPIIQNGLTGRSFVNNVMVPVGNTTLAQDLINSNSVRILFLGMEGTSKPDTFGNSWQFDSDWLW